MADNTLLDLFLNSGLEKRRADETLKNVKLSKVLGEILKEATALGDVKPRINVLYTVASTLVPEAGVHRSELIKYVMEDKIGKNNINFALAYLKKLGADPLKKAEFENECGVGVVITKEDVTKMVADLINQNKAKILEDRYAYPLPSLLVAARDKMKHANAKDVKDEVDAQILTLLGPKTAADNEKIKAKNETKKSEGKKEVEATATQAQPEEKDLITFPDPRDNKQLKASILEAHLQKTGGLVVCRFPPEPNGYLHLGHAKAMNLNFWYPKKSGGYTFLRYDDTNPEAEKQEYFDAVEDDCKWLGHSPKEVTFSSDYFPQLYDLAIKLIKNGKAYVCHQTSEQMSEGRELKRDSPWRNRSVEENLKEFDNMRRGKYEEGTATLRMKMDMKSDNPCMRDLVAYRIKYTPHPHTGDKWCIYPSYDYTHCIIDSFENITHSLCTLEFYVRRESYYWLLDALELYKPIVWEYSRLNITHTVMSKRKLNKLVTGGYVKGWDDPRMPTLRAMRRRGYPPEAINNFCDKIGVTRNDGTIFAVNLLEQCVREVLDETCPRHMLVLKPLKVTITNMDDKITTVDVPNSPKDKSKGTHSVPFCKVIYIEATDFRMEDVKGYKRLAPNKEVGLLHTAGVIKCTEVVKDKDGNVIELKATYDPKPAAKPKGFIHWVAQPALGEEPSSAEVRLYDHLFKSEDPGSLEKWLEDMNPASLQILNGAFMEPCLKNAKVGDRVQFERIGYFVVDLDSSKTHKVWNRIVGLKESKWEDN